MPIPKPNDGESQSEFVSRCISKIIDEYEGEQAAAICNSTYRKKEEMKEKKKLMVIIPKKSENRGMYLSRCSNNSRMKSQIPNMKDRLSFCLTSFNEYYKYWNRIEMGEVPKESALGICIAAQKAKGFDYKEAYAHCASKIGNKPLGSGEQINLNEDLLVEPVEFNEMDIFGYMTTYFYICPGAQATFNKLVEDVDDEETMGMVRTAAQVADNVFRIEAEVKEKNKATEKELNAAMLLVSDFKDIIEEIQKETEIIYDISYMDGHIGTIKKYI